MHRIPSPATGRRLGALSLAVALGAGLPLASAPAFAAPGGLAAQAAAATPKPDSGQGTLSIDGSSAVKAGGKLTVKGTGFVAKDELSFKLDDGAYTANGTDIVASATTDDQGAFSLEFTVPGDVSVGDHWIRALSGNGSHHVAFTVTAADSPAPAAEATVNAPATWYEGQPITVTGKNWKNGDGATGSVVAVKLDMGGVNRKYDLKDPIKGTSLGNKTIMGVAKAKDDGSFSITIPYPTLKNSDTAYKVGDKPSFTFLSGSMQAGDPVRSLAAETEVAPSPALHTDELTVSQSAVTDVPLTQGTDLATAKVAGKETSVVRGLYQTAYSKKHGSIYAAAVGRPPVKDSALVKLNADTLEVEKAIAPPVDPTEEGEKAGARYAAYGVSADDANNRVWVTNTRQNTVAVYDADTLALVKQFPKGATPHSRDVLADAASGKAFVSNNSGQSISVFDGKTLEQQDDIALRDGFKPMSLKVVGSTLYTTDIGSPTITKIDTKTHKVTYLDIPAKLESASGIDVDPASGTIAVAGQAGSANVVLLDKDGKLLKEIAVAGPANEEGDATAGGSLSVAFDAVNKWFYVANRTANSITVYDTDGNLVQTLDSGKFANHVQADGRGNVYAVNKGGARTTATDGTAARAAEPDLRDYVQKFTGPAVPTPDPTEPTEAPTSDPTDQPTTDPTAEPTADPTGEPTDGSSQQPSDSPSDDGKDDGSGDNGSGDDGDNGSGDNGSDDNGSDDNGSGDNGSGGSLPRTGAAVGAAVAAGAALILVGGAAVTITRRRTGSRK
ncbi:hypothetical protein GSY69_09130 [Brevibacterium sp. 5221]|uniref:Gram-positive cocci surface proteins LPxTG domain-containing protein n=1 Tax=Brevibacterium rongguiense TaxID=2695267 RepID=A0A6N9H9B8_9MICO|nr:hypothetical protein [Brevibacterium rongguiense]MYM20124.1 hypothetical protein [Brevibacterium rongguiense]